MGDADDIAIHMGSHTELETEARFLDWGVLTTDSQGGPAVFVVGLGAEEAAELLRKVATRLDQEVANGG